tara:strand:- start:449 stop:1087 length:639 start_codon:yes stop_codon:yes gene_type:complete
MLLIYDHDNVLHITNDRGLRWNYDKADKPQFSFDYDFLFYIEQDNLFEIELGDDTSIITDEQKSEIIEYINLLEPPLKLTLANQYIEDLQEQTIRRINFVYEDIACDVCRFPSSAEIMIAGREGSQDPRRQIARRIMEWTDFAHGLCERIVEELKKTLDEDLKEYPFYEESLAEIPKIEHFLEDAPVDERFNTDTLDIHGGEDNLGEDKKAV